MKSSDILEIRDSKLYANNVHEDIKILSAGDFHVNPKTKEEMIDFYLESVYVEEPDYIFLLGDLMDNPKDIDKTAELLFKIIRGSSNIAPTFVIIGNHDYISNGIDITNKELLDDINNINNVRLLNDKTFRNDEIAIMGYTQKINAYYNNDNNAFESFYEDFSKHEKFFNINLKLPKIALMHSPEFVIEDKTQELLKEYDLIICGHYHNGCVPPILDKMWNSDKGFINARRYLFPSNVRGIQQLKYNYLVYNGGFVKLSKSTAKKLSFLDNMYHRQIDVITLTGDSDYKEIDIKTRYKKRHKKRI